MATLPSRSARALVRTDHLGTTLLELLTTLTVGAVILGGVFSMLLVSQVSSAETMTISRVEQSAKLSVLKIQNEVIESSVESPDWSLADQESAETLTFNRCAGSRDGAKLWSPPITFRKEGTRLLRSAEGGQIQVADGIQTLSFSLRAGLLRVAVTARGDHRGRFSYTTAAAVECAPRN